MKRLVLILAITLLVFGGTVAVPIYTASAEEQGTLQDTDGDGIDDMTVTADRNAWNPPDIPIACNINHLLECLMDGFAWLALLALQTALFAVAVAGAVLDYSLYFLALQMGEWIGKGSGIGEGIALGWTIFRDLGNLALIGALVWAAISMILNSGGLGLSGGKPGAAIAKIIVAALLVNFSYFFAGALVDASNVLSRLIYQQGIQGVAISLAEGSAGTLGQLQQGATVIGESVAPGADAVGGMFGHGEISEQTASILSSLKVPGDVQVVFAAVFLQQTRLLTVIDPAYLSENIRKSGFFFTMTAAAVALLIATLIIFFSITFMIIARFVIIIALLVTSPVFVLGFTGIAKLKEWGDHWWKALVNQTVFLPVFLLLAMISFNVIGAFWAGARPFLDSGATFMGIVGEVGSGNFKQFEEAVKLILLFGISWGLLKLSLIVAKSIATGASMALPDPGKLSEGFAKAGEWVGKGAAWPVNLPKRLVYKPITDIVKRGVGGIGDTLSTVGRKNPFASKDTKHQRHIEERQEKYILDNLKTPYHELDSDTRKSIGEVWNKMTDEQKRRVKKGARTKEQKEGVEDVETLHGGAPHAKPHEKAPETKPATSPSGQVPPGHAVGTTFTSASDGAPGRRALADNLKFSQTTQRGVQYAAPSTSIKQGGEDFRAGFDRIDSRLAGMEAHDRQRAWNERRMELIDEAKEEKNAKYMVSHLAQRFGKEMPHEVMAHPNVLAEVNEQHVIDYAARGDVSNEKFAEIISGLQQIGRQSVVSKVMTNPVARRRTWSNPPLPPSSSSPPPTPQKGTTI